MAGKKNTTGNTVFTAVSSVVTFKGREITLEGQSQESLASLFALGCPGIKKEEPQSPSTPNTPE